MVRNTRRTDPAMGSVPEVGGRGGGRRRLPGPRTTPSGPAETCAPHGDRAGELSSGGCHSAGKKIVLAAGDIRTLSANGGWNSTESPDGFPCQAPESLLGLQITPLSKTRQTGNVMLTKGGFNKAVSAEATILWGAVANYPLVQFRLLVNQIFEQKSKEKIFDEHNQITLVPKAISRFWQCFPEKHRSRNMPLALGVSQQRCVSIREVFISARFYF